MKKGGMDRDPLPLDRLYPGKPKLTEAEYLAGQGGDKAESKARFF